MTRVEPWFWTPAQLCSAGHGCGQAGVCSQYGFLFCVDEPLSLGKKPPSPQHTSVPTLERRLPVAALFNKHGSSFFIFKTVLCIPAHHPLQPGHGGGWSGNQPEGAPWTCVGRVVLPVPPSPTLDASQLPTEFALGPSHIQRPASHGQVRRRVELGLAHGGCPQLLLLLLEPAQASVKTYSLRCFYYVYTFSCFILGKKMCFFDTHKTIQGNWKMHIQF